MKINLICFDATINGRVALMAWADADVMVIDNCEDSFTHPANAVLTAANMIVKYANLNTPEIAIYCRGGGIPNFLGHMIDRKLISHEDVVIYLYTENGHTLHYYSDEGYLMPGWPMGCLEWDVDAGLEIVQQLRKD